MDPLEIIGLLFGVFAGAMIMNALRSIPAQHRPLPGGKCDRHPGTARCVCRGNLYGQ